MEKFKFYYNGQVNLPKHAGIYAIVNILNNKKYVGSTSNLSKRYRQHFNLLVKNKHINIHLQNAYNKYGNASFEFWILEQCDDIPDTLLLLEQKYIDSDGDYNICKIAGKTTGIKGKAHEITEYQRIKIIEANKNRIWTKEELERRSLLMKNSPLVASQRKPVLQYSTDNKLLNEFDSIMSAARYLKNENARVSIKRCCQRKQKLAYNFKWRYKYDNKNDKQ